MSAPSEALVVTAAVRLQLDLAAIADAVLGAAGLLLATRRRWSPFVLLHLAGFPGSPELFALPAGNLGQAPPWNFRATAGLSRGLI